MFGIYHPNSSFRPTEYEHSLTYAPQDHAAAYRVYPSYSLNLPSLHYTSCNLQKKHLFLQISESLRLNLCIDFNLQVSIIGL